VSEAVAVFDVGKSSAKLALVDRESGATIAVRTTPNVTRKDGPYPHFDVEALWAWLTANLAAFAREARIGVISTTTHGACVALTAGDALALPIIDYEFAGPDQVANEYRKLRGGFRETFSPDLPGGLNVGRQLFWLERTFPDAFARIDAILPYPQYWGWRLSGVKAAEPTCLGAHSDLWAPVAGTFSQLAKERGWAALFPKLGRPWDTIGTILPDIARATGLPADCRIVAGIHDSNASLLPHLLAEPLPFTVISTGTWIITLAPGGGLDALDPARDCLAYIDAFARPVPASMWMGGREFEALTGGAAGEPSDAEVARVVRDGVMVLPAATAGSGPFRGRRGGWAEEPAGLRPGERTGAASLYCALVAETCLALTGSKGPVLVEGPFARNRVFLGALAQLTGRRVTGRTDATGTTGGAALLAEGPEGFVKPAVPELRASTLGVDLAGYAAAWRERVADGRK
jgi:sugar (pentulose or hexulose) kinase